MPTEKGIVIKVLKDEAVVRVKRSDACCGCPSSRICQLGGSGTREVIAKNALCAEVGEEVEIEIKEGLLLRASFIMYIIPVLGLLAGGLFGRWVVIKANLPFGQDEGAILGGITLMILVFLAIRIMSKRKSIRDNYQPTITRRI